MQRGARVLEFSLANNTTADQAHVPDNRLIAGKIAMDSWIHEEDGNIYWQTKKDTRISKLSKVAGHQDQCCRMKTEELEFINKTMNTLDRDF